MENILLTEILDAREKRVKKQNSLIEQFKKPLLCFTMNIPGPMKLDRDVSIGFFVGNKLLADALSRCRVLYAEQSRLITGCEGYYVVDLPARKLKALAVELEDIEPIGRLFDMDVIDTDGRRISREELGHSRRSCLLCDEDAVVCAGRRTHSLEELTDRVGFLLYITARRELCEYVAARAYFALHQEVSTTPKPGLVDRNNRGSHYDMGPKEFFASAVALRPFFCRFAEAGFLSRDADPQDTFLQLRSIGLEAEAAMYKATHGVNTHKGAIFSLGLLCAACGRLDPYDWTPENLLAACARMTEGICQADFAGVTVETAKTAGEKLFSLYGITGVRGQAEAGFPAVLNVGLPVFREGLSRGLNENDAGAVALLHLLAATDDTNLISRSDRQTQLAVKAQVAQMLAQNPYPTMEEIKELDEQFIQKNLSPGGSADLLAITVFLHFLS